MGLPLDPIQCGEVALSGKRRRIDLGLLEGIPFACVLGLGIGAGLAVGIAGFGTGTAQAGVGAGGTGAIAEKPELLINVLILFAIPETIVIFGMVIAFMLMGNI